MAAKVLHNWCLHADHRMSGVKAALLFSASRFSCLGCAHPPSLRELKDVRLGHHFVRGTLCYLAPFMLQVYVIKTPAGGSTRSKMTRRRMSRIDYHL
ncbi:hypothetical protein OAO87_02185 [bacterium]|nr:hypothetical protein [bacterium]